MVSGNNQPLKLPGLEKVLKYLHRQIRSSGEYLRFAFQGRPDPASAILLAGSGRSGTTWVSDVICSWGSGVQVIFEPLHPTFNSEVRRLTAYDESDPHIRSYYLRPEGSHPEWEDFWRRLLSGRVRNYWTDVQRTSFFPNRFLIKAIRANLMLKFVHQEFQPKIVFLMRHPCAVVHSRLNKVDIPWYASVADLLSQPALVEDFLRPWLKEAEAERDLLGAHAVWWAVENYAALQQLKGCPRVFLTHYETLSMQPVTEFTRLIDWLDIPKRKPSMRALSRPSRMTRADRFIHEAHKRLGQWRHAMSREDQYRVLDWAHRFGLDFYSDQVLPASTWEVQSP